MLQNLYIFVFNNDLTSNPNMIFPGWMFIQLPINPSKVSQPGLWAVSEGFQLHLHQPGHDGAGGGFSSTSSPARTARWRWPTRVQPGFLSAPTSASSLLTTMTGRVQFYQRSSLCALPSVGTLMVTSSPPPTNSQFIRLFLDTNQVCGDLDGSCRPLQPVWVRVFHHQRSEEINKLTR